MAYAVIRTDLMSGTKQPADLVSLRFYDASGNKAEVENGVIVNPFFLSPDHLVSDANELMGKYKISGVPRQNTFINNWLRNIRNLSRGCHFEEYIGTPHQKSIGAASDLIQYLCKYSYVQPITCCVLPP